jgi:Pentapeptide repeats (8 copies)
VHLDRANLTGVNLNKADLRDAVLAQAKLIDADLSEADLRGANFADATVRDASFGGARYDARTVWPEHMREPQCREAAGCEVPYHAAAASSPPSVRFASP